MDNNHLLIVEDLRKHFPLRKGFFGKPMDYLRAVDGVDLFIQKGETLGLVGESGCGKTTLGRCILRLEEPTAGKILFENENVLTLSPERMRSLRQDMQIIFQDPYSSLDPRKTAGHIIGEPLIIHRALPRKERQEKVRELMEVVGLLPEHVHRYPHEFSGGQRQRIGVARALALNPKLVIADEPVSALDVSIQAQILNLLVRLQRQFDLTYLFISHALNVVRHISDRVAVMYLGKIVEMGNSRSLYSHPFHPYSEALIAAAPLPDPLRQKRKTLLEGDVPSHIQIPSGCSFHPRCSYRQEMCKQEIPRLDEIEEGRWVACHFPISSAP
jgi:oligopeptide/dipeptide ABC transporter ATP-binding protein